MSDAEPGPAAAAREHLLAEHGETLQAVLDAADAVATGDPESQGDATGEGGDAEFGSAAAGWLRLDDGRLATPNRDALVPVFRAVLDDRGVLDELPELLAAAVDAAGYELPATPVPAPPYVAVTSTGPVLRGTVEDGRLVVRIDCFEVVGGVDWENYGESRENDIVYARTVMNPAAALSVSFEHSE